MAKRMNGLLDEGSLDTSWRLEPDRCLSPDAMRAYLLYQLYLVENQIGSLFKKVEEDGQRNPDWAWCHKSNEEEMWVSWTGLNYFLNARDSLRRTLRTLNRVAR